MDDPRPSGRGLIDFLNFATDRGLMNANTAGGLRAACREVLSVAEGEDWESTDLQTVDAHDVTSRFERLRAGKLKPDTLLVYKSRFRNALQMYFEYLESPSSWRYKPTRPATGRKRPAPRSGSNRQAGAISDVAERAPGKMTSSSTATIDYPFPLRSGLVASLRLPVNLTSSESKRLAAFIDTLAVDQSISQNVEGPSEQ